MTKVLAVAVSANHWCTLPGCASSEWVRGFK